MADNSDGRDNFYQKADIIQGLEFGGVTNTRIAGSAIEPTQVMKGTPIRIGVGPIALYFGAHLWMPGQEAVRSAIKNGIEGMDSLRPDYRHEK